MSDAAPLIATPDAPIPAGAEPAWIKGAGGVRLRAALFRPKGRPRGSIVLSGGRTEVIEKYFETIQDLLDRDFVVLAHDWRGQGLSHRALGDPLKGHADGAKAFLDDFRLLLDAYADRLPKPWVALGHSMGGCLTLLAMVHGETRFAGAILSAPMLGVQTGGRSLGAARALVGISKLLGRGKRYVLNDPGKPFDDVFETNILTHDQRRYARNCAQLKAEPQLALGAPTWGWLDFALKATAELARPERLRGVTVPVVIVSAGEDKLVDNEAQKAAARYLPQGQFINVPGAYHEILMETDEMRNIFLRALDALTGRVAPKPAEPPKATPATPPKPAEPATASVSAAAPSAGAPTPAPAKAEAPASTPAAAPKTSTAKASSAKKTPAKSASKAAATKAPSTKASASAKASTTKASSAKAPASKSSAAKTASAKTAAKPAAKSAAKPATKAAAKPAAKPAAAKKTATTTAKSSTAKPASAPKTATAKSTASKAAKPAAAKKASTAKAATAKPAAKSAAAKATTAKKPAAKKPAAK